MSQAIQSILNDRIPVFSKHVKDPVPLGTPDDVKKFEDDNLC